MSTAIAVGGGTSGVAASAHAGCERFRGTDPIITGRTRRRLAESLGFPDTTGVIPEARWMRAMLFERLVHDEQFVSEVMTRGLGELDLERPAAVRHVECRRSPRRTVQALADAHDAAQNSNIATMLTGLVVPMAGFDGANATPVLPDFAVVASQTSAAGSWLIAGDAKDYERVRSRIDDGRLLKGFLQVALAAESFDQWSQLPGGMQVHAYGFLAVPRSSYLRPEVVVEELTDHRHEVRERLAQRIGLSQEVALGEGAGASRLEGSGQLDLATVSHLRAEFDPARCVTCSLFNFCRNELRNSSKPEDLLVEIGLQRPHRPMAEPLLSDPTAEVALPVREVLNVAATITGLPQWTKVRRVDPVGAPGTVNVVLVKSDAATLGVHGMAVQVVTDDGLSPWQPTVFTDPQSPVTRTRVLRNVGEALEAAIQSAEDERPVHVCVPDRATADLLATMADSAAGVEISRLSWERDRAQGRKPVTFDGRDAAIPDPLDDHARLATSFLLDEDRARAFALRDPVVVVQGALGRHLVPGGPWSDASRLDYLVTWGEARSALDHRRVSDAVEGDVHAPGARMTTVRSDEIHAAYRSKDWTTYSRLVSDELSFRTRTLDRAAALLGNVSPSRLREVHEVIEMDAQRVWRRRVAFHASDLVRFSLTSRHWRNELVDPLDQDGACLGVLNALLDPGAALDLARDAGNRGYVEAEVVRGDPLQIRSTSRALVDGAEVMAIHVGGVAVFEQPTVTLKVNKTAFAFSGVTAGPIAATADPSVWSWAVAGPSQLEVGARLTLLVVSSLGNAGKLVRQGKQFNLVRPSPDQVFAPRESCLPGDYDEDPDTHQWCCKPHEVAAAERADWFAERRAAGQMNPEVWPPLIDYERFPSPGEEDLGADFVPPDKPDGVTLDDLE